jgi:hypothetical protein
MHLTSENLVFLLSSFVVPTLFVALNFFVRRERHWYYSAGSDFLLTEMTFSFTSVALYRDMSLHVRNEYIRESFVAVYMVMGILLLICWLWTVSTVEAEVNVSIRNHVLPPSFPQGKLFCAWGAVIIFFAAEVMSFIYR